MATMAQLFRLRRALMKDFERRKVVIDMIYDACKGAFTQKSIEKLKTIASQIVSVRKSITNARKEISDLNCKEDVFADAVKTLDAEKQYIADFYVEYFQKIFGKDIDLEWVRKNIQVDKLKTLAHALRQMKINEKTFIRDIDLFVSKTTQQKREALERFG